MGRELDELDSRPAAALFEGNDLHPHTSPAASGEDRNRRSLDHCRQKKAVTCEEDFFTFLSVRLRRASFSFSAAVCNSKRMADVHDIEELLRGSETQEHTSTCTSSVMLRIAFKNTGISLSMTILRLIFLYSS